MRTGYIISYNCESAKENQEKNITFLPASKQYRAAY